MIKEAVKRLAVNSGLMRLLSPITGSHISIILYHGVCETACTNGLFRKMLPLDMFEQHLKVYKSYGTAISLQEAMAGSRSIRNPIVITFDDGYANNYNLVFPLLQAYGIPATVFLTTGFIDRKVFLGCDWIDYIAFHSQGEDAKSKAERCVHLSRYYKSLPHPDAQSFLDRLQRDSHVEYTWRAIPRGLEPLSWDEIRAMRRSGLISFGSHTFSHPILSRCSSEVQEFELSEAKRRIECELDEECRFFAYPNGMADDYTEVTKSLAAKAGYTLALTAETGYNCPPFADQYELRRWGGGITSTKLAYLVSGGARAVEYLRNREWRN
ncbi:MAG: polysaccharide deacetylase family protein [Acidobacteria bacterium]|nr:polysaccharide deacetylase family protein [Acidobacteriota bacterium]